MGGRPTLVAFTGIDGAGKTTLIRGLQASDPRFATAPVLKRTEKENVWRLLRFRPHLWSDPASVMRSASGRLLAWATVLDFLRYVDEEVLPRCEERLVLLDRWTPCMVAYCGEVLGIGDEVVEALADVPKPDLIIHVDVTPAEAYARITRARHPLPDEHPEILRAFHRAYTAVYAKHLWPPVRTIAGASATEAVSLATAALEAEGCLV